MKLFEGKLDLLLLATVAHVPRHGYAIIADLRERSGGLLDLKEGSVYPALHRLEREGLIVSEPELADGRRRRNYRLTEPGRTALAAQRKEWDGFVQGFTAILTGPPA